MLVKQLPPPLRRLLGPLSNSREVLAAFGLTSPSVDPDGDVSNGE
jgi:hypothetical protein